MNDLKNFNVIIPLRAGSKGMPNKNISLLAGKPLYLHSLDHAKSIRANRIIVTTDINEVIKNSKKENYEVIKRPKKLCTDNATMSSVIVHAVKKAEISGTIILLQPTSPLRSIADIKKCIQVYFKYNPEIVLSITKANSAVLKFGSLDSDNSFQPFGGSESLFKNRQYLPQVFKPNGAIFIFDAKWILKNRDLSMAKSIHGVKMPLARSYDIDTEEDFNICENQLIYKRN